MPCIFPGTMTRTILGLDVGGANLKTATPDGRAVNVPFALWKQPDKLPAALAELTARFPNAVELAVTMTGELCDCYQTKREGVNAILDAVEQAAAGRPVRVWSTGGEFRNVAASRSSHLTVAAANWHGLATFAARFAPTGMAVVVDVGSTTTDVTMMENGRLMNRGCTDSERLNTSALLYTGVRRTPVCAVLSSPHVAAELFATTQDVYLIHGELPEDSSDHDTADGRPATRQNAFARLARMVGGDTETLSETAIVQLATAVSNQQSEWIAAAIIQALGPTDDPVPIICCGSGEFLIRAALAHVGTSRVSEVITLTDRLGPVVSACAPAYAVAVLATERPL